MSPDGIATDLVVCPSVGAAFESDLIEAARLFGVARLTLMRSDDGFVLEGVSPTYYGKQMAQELARKANLTVLANRIVVEQRLADGT